MGSNKACCIEERIKLLRIKIQGAHNKAIEFDTALGILVYKVWWWCCHWHTQTAVLEKALRSVDVLLGQSDRGSQRVMSELPTFPRRKLFHFHFAAGMFLCFGELCKSESGTQKTHYRPQFSCVCFTFSPTTGNCERNNRW